MSASSVKALLVLVICTLAMAGWFIAHNRSWNHLHRIVREDGIALLVNPDSDAGGGGGEGGRGGRNEGWESAEAGGGSDFEATLAVHSKVLEMVEKLRRVTDAKQAELDALRKSSRGVSKVEAEEGNVGIKSSPSKSERAEPLQHPSTRSAPVSCARQSLLHGSTLAELEATYSQNGEFKWALVDAFTTSGETVAAELKGSSLITFVVTAHVYAGPPYNLPVGKAKPRRRDDYDKLMQQAGLKWTCTFGKGNTSSQNSTYTSAPAVSPKLDGDKHILVVHCKLPAGVLGVHFEGLNAGGVAADGRLNTPAGLEATFDDGRAALHYSNVHACTADLVPPALDRGACTMFGEMKPLNVAEAAAAWTRFMLAAGFQFVALYLDPSSGGVEDLESAVRKALAAEVSAGTVSLVRFHMAERVAFETQTAQQMHCHWRFRGRATWLAQLDIDEYLQPLGTFQTIGEVLTKYEKKNAAALQIRNRYWDHHPTDEKDSFARSRHDVWNMVWRDARKSMHGREKLIYRPAMVDYMAVHRVTLGGKMAKPNAGTEIRHNHFSRHFKGTDEGVGCGGRESQGKHCQGAMKEVVKDLSFLEFYRRTVQ